MLDSLIHLIDRVGHWGYLVVFVGATLESAAFLGVIVPGESLVLVSGFFAAQGVLDLGVLILVVAVGAACGDSIGYELGRRLGRQWLLRFGGKVGVTRERLDRVEVFFDRHGGKSVFLGRFIGFARAIVPFLAGSTRMPYRVFLPYNMAGALLWSTVAVLLGYFLGASWQVAERWIGRASAILGGLLLFIVVLVWVWRAAARNEAGVKRAWQRFLVRVGFEASRRRLSPLFEFLRARLSPTGYLGLHLTMGAVILIGAGWLFGAIAEDVVNGDPLTVVDSQIAAWFHARAAPTLTDAMLAVTHFNGPAGITILALLLLLYLFWRREWTWLGALVLTVPGGMLLNVLTKHAFRRDRPSFADPLVTLTTYSFPSGHVAGATLFYGFLAVYLVPKMPTWRWRVLTVLTAFFVIALIGLSRLYLGVHFLSDVLAAFAESTAWLALALTAVHSFRTSQPTGATPSRL
ncbi:MAG: bifunctional DedA family/phosphatase PAP2 family protein [Betaproteobacteria bacterium]